MVVPMVQAVSQWLLTSGARVQIEVIYTFHSPTDAHLLKLVLLFTLQLDGCYMFRSTTIIRELAIKPG